MARVSEFLEKTDHRRRRRRRRRRRLMEQHRLAGEKNPFEQLLKDDASLQSQSNLRHMLAALRRRTEKLKRQMRSMKSRRKAWNRISTMVVVGLLIVSLLLASLFAPAVTAAVAAAPAAAATIIQAVEPLFNSAWDEAENELEGREEILKTLQLTKSVAHGLQGVRPLAEASAVAFDSIKNRLSASALLHGDEAALVAARAAVEEADERATSLGKQVDFCKSELNRIAELFDELKPVMKVTEHHHHRRRGGSAGTFFCCWSGDGLVKCLIDFLRSPTRFCYICRYD